MYDTPGRCKTNKKPKLHWFSLLQQSLFSLREIWEKIRQISVGLQYDLLLLEGKQKSRVTSTRPKGVKGKVFFEVIRRNIVR